MGWLSIATVDDAEEMNTLLRQEFLENVGCEQGALLKIEKNVHKEVTLFTLILQNVDICGIEEVQKKVGSIVVDYIIRFSKFKYIYRYIEKKYSNLTTNERDIICTRIIKYFIHHHIEKSDTFLLQNFEEKMLTRCIQALKEQPMFNIEGFFIFRLGDYRGRLEQIVDQIITEYLTEMEYNEFIQLLKYFVTIQESLLEAIHIYPKTHRKYELFNENKEDITQMCIEEFRKDVETLEINYDDMLISTLITTSPNKVIIHEASKFQNKEILDTIVQVFKEKVEFSHENDGIQKNVLDISLK